MHDDAAEAEQGDEVWYRHESVHAVGDIPYKTEANDTAHEYTDDVEHTVCEHPFLTLEVFHATLAVVTPS